MPWERESLVVFPCGNGAFANRGSCAALHHIFHARLAADQLLLCPEPQAGQGRFPPLRHKTGLIHRFVGLPWMGTQAFRSCGQPEALCWELLCLLGEVNKPWWCGQSGARVSAPCAAGSWDQPSPLPVSHRGFFGIRGWSGRHSPSLSCPEQRFPCVPVRSGHPCGLSRWNLWGELGSDSKQERPDGVN